MSDRLARSARRPTLNDVWLAAVLALTFAAANSFPVDQTDYWWTVKLGEGLWATGQLPATDPLAFTSTREPYVEQQWLAQLVLAAVHSLGGLDAAMLLRAVLLVATIGLVFSASRRARVGGGLAALASILALLLVLPGAATRPQLLALPLFALFLAATTVWQARAWTLVALPLAMAIWVNIHGSFPIGIGLIGCALLGRLWALKLEPTALRDGCVRRLALLLVLCATAVLVNPYGPGLLSWLVDFLTLHTGGKDAAVIATEWAPTSLGERVGMYYFASVMVLVVVLVSTGPPATGDGWRLLAFGLLGLVAVRNTPWWGMVQAPALASGAAALGRAARRALLPPDGIAADAPDEASPAPRQGRPLLNAALIVACVLAALVSLPPLRAALTGSPGLVADPNQPREAAGYLASLARPLRLFNALDWGGYLAWRLAPTDRIFVDGRFGIYPPSVYRDYFQISAAQPGWQERLQAYGVDALVLDRRAQRGLLQALATERAWQAAYCDDLAAVYLPAGVAGGAVVCGPAD